MIMSSKKYTHRGLKNPLVKQILPRYVKVAKGQSWANFQIAKRILVDFDKSLTTAQLWKEHEKLMKNFYETKAVVDKNKLRIEDLEIPRFSLLDLKMLLVREIMKSCNLCERKCEANRIENQLGMCKVGNRCLISSEFMHMGEEFFISPSHTIFFSGCSFNCQYCQNFTISQWYEDGVPISSRVLAKAIGVRRKEGSLNVNFVGGEPTPQLLWVLETLKYCETNLPVLWNSNMYMSQKTMKVLDGVVDMYLSDFKYGNDQCALRLSKVKNFFEVCSRNHLLAAKQAELTIRHLIIPNHVDCCTKPILEWIAKNLQSNSLVNIMDQFKPDFHAKEYPEIGRRITEEELKQAIGYAKKLKLNFIT